MPEPAASSGPAQAASASFGVFERIRGDLRSYLPRGRSLPDEVWKRRHDLVLGLLAAHGLAFFVYAGVKGFGWWHAALEGAIVFLALGIAWAPWRSRVLRSSVAAAGLVTCSAILVHLSGGLIEMHFHFFVALAVITLYQEWLPFLVSIFYVVLHHGVIGAIEPTAVFNHAQALGNPWRWAIIHGLFVSGACLAYAVQWRFNEDLRDHAELLLDAAGEGIVGLDSNGMVAFANPAAGRLLASRPQALVGRFATDLFSGLDLPRRGAGRPSWEARPSQEIVARPLLGAAFPAECTVTPVVRRREAQGHVVAFKDIRERKRAEQERLQAEKDQVERLRTLDELKTQFINTAAHELRTPLMPLGLQVEILQLQAATKQVSEPERMALDVLGRNFERLKRLIEDMLSVAQIEAGRVTLNREAVDLGAILAEARDVFAPVAQRGGVSLAIDVPASTWVDGDPLRLNQIVFNLLSNAIRHTPEGGTVRLTVEPRPMVRITVSDTGAGLTPEQLARLFRPFGQVHDGAPTQRQGTGLGLFIAKSLVELHGGTIVARSGGTDKGASFSFTIPAATTGLVRLLPRETGEADRVHPPESRAPALD